MASTRAPKVCRTAAVNCSSQSFIACSMLITPFRLYVFADAGRRSCLRATPSFVCRGPAKCAPAAPRLSRILLPDSASSEQDSCGLRAALARATRARAAHRRALRLPGRLFGAFRHYSAGRGQAAAAPLFAPHGTGAGRPYPMDPTLGRAQPILTRRQTHCSRRSRLKFFAEAFFQKGRSAAG